MRIEVIHIFKLGEVEREFLTDLIKQSRLAETGLIQIEQGIKSLRELIMKSQAQIDKLTEEVKSNTAGLSAELTKEAEEIKAAIDSSQIDTTKLEAAIAENKGLTDRVKDLFTPETEETPVEPPVEEPTPVEEEPTPTP